MTLLDRILSLALQAMGDVDSLPVLGDLIIEARWRDHRVANLLAQGHIYAHISKAERRRWLALSAAPTLDFARAVAAVLMCRCWYVSRWLGVASSWFCDTRSVYDILRSLYPSGSVGRIDYPAYFRIGKTT